MPEYLAPGVYVEETSFRSKSIEGVGTSTTALVGPTRKGPYGVPPELLTSFGDFERIYGGFENLSLDNNTPAKNINYIAHAVRAYFDNGGSRLYVSRVIGGLDPNQPNQFIAQSEDLLGGAPEVVKFMARFPGEGGNGEIQLYQKATPVNLETMKNAPIGSVLRIGGGEGKPARLPPGNEPPFSLNDGSKLLVALDGVDQTPVVFRGQVAEVVSVAALDTQINIPANTSLQVTIGQNGKEQSILLPAGNTVSPADVVETINRNLRGGYARLTKAAEGTAGQLAIGTEIRGKNAWIEVKKQDLLKFPIDQIKDNKTDAANNNVGDLDQVTVADFKALLPVGIDATLENGKLVLLTSATGATKKLQVKAGQPADKSVHSLLGLTTDESPPGKGAADITYYLKTQQTQQPEDWTNGTNTLKKADLDANPGANLLSLTVVARDLDGNEVNYEDLGFSPDHPRWVGSVFAKTPTRPSDALTNPFSLDVKDLNLKLDNPSGSLTLREGLFTPQDNVKISIDILGEEPKEPAIRITLKDGKSGQEPTPEDYVIALKALESLEDISIVAAPGHTAYDKWADIQDKLITHVSRRRAYQIAVLDTPNIPETALNQVRAVRSRLDSKYAALYYPWVMVSNPLSRSGSLQPPSEIAVPPSGFVCGIYARNDIERGVYKAPANEVVRGTSRLTANINFAQQEVLNPLGINCLRFFPGRGYRLWGARTISSDPEWKYVNVRRYFNYLEASIDRGTQWAVFEPNGERLWANVRDTISAFLYNEWVSGALLGGTAQEAYFVRCDRSTMTQNDLDNGRLICLIGVAVIKPAEFVIFRIGQKTADTRS